MTAPDGGGGVGGAGTRLSRNIQRNNSNSLSSKSKGGGGNGNNNENSLLSSRRLIVVRGGGGGGGVSRYSRSIFRSNRRFLYSSIVMASLLGLVLMNLVYLHGRLDVMPSSSTVGAGQVVANEQQQQQQYKSTTLRRRRRRQTEAMAIAPGATAGSMAFHGGNVFENDILKRIRQDLQTKWQACASALQQQNYKRFGLLQLLDEYFVEHNSNQTAAVINNNNNHNSSLLQSSCVLPESSFAACNVTSMAIIAYTTTTTTTSSNIYDQQYDPINHRRVLLSILQWLLDPRVQEIWLLVPVQHRTSFVNNSEYGQRLLLWEFKTNSNDNQQRREREQFRNNNPDQQVFVVFCESLMQGVNIVEAESQQVAMMWMNANPTTTTTTTTDSTTNDVSDTRSNLFQAWQQDASAIHVSSSSSLLLEWQGSNTTSSLRRAVPSSCPSSPPSLSTSHGNTQDHQWQQQQHEQWLPYLSGTMHHRSYLCFLQHPMLAKSITAMSSSSSLLQSSSWSQMVYSSSALWLWMVASSSSSLSSMSSPTSQKTGHAVAPRVLYWPVDKDAPNAKVKEEKRNYSLPDSVIWFHFGGPTEVLTRMLNMQQRRHLAHSSLCATSNFTETKQVGFFWN